MGNLVSRLLPWLTGNAAAASITEEQLQQVNVVIIGAGYVGIDLGVTLLKARLPFTIIDPKDYFHHRVGALRAVVDKDYATRTVIPLKVTFGQHFVQGQVASVDLNKRTVTLESGQVMHFSHLVFATGSKGVFPCRTTEPSAKKLLHQYERFGDEIDKATDVVIIGGGAVGVEFAGEIADKYSAKNITIVHSGKELVSPDLGPTFQKRIRNLLDAKQIRLMLEDRVANFDELSFGQYKSQTVKTAKGENLHADIVLCCIGLRPDNDLAKRVFDGSLFDEAHRLKVTPELLVEGHTDVYAVGDCCNTAEDKMAAFATYHAEVVAKNIQRSIRQDMDRVPYSTKFRGMLVPVGKNAGAGVINGWNFPSFLVTMAKSKSLFTSKFWKLMGQPEPC